MGNTRNDNSQRKPKGSKAIIIKIDPKKHRDLRIYCAEHGVQMASLVREFIDNLLKK